MPATILPETTPRQGASLGNTLGQLIAQLGQRRRRQLLVLLLLMLAGAGAELLSLGAVIPFVTVLAHPAKAANHAAIAWLMRIFNVGLSDLPVAISAAFVVMILLSMVARLLLMWANIRFSNGLGAELSELLYARTLQRPYTFHVSRNTSQIMGSINKVQKLIVGYVQPLLTGITAAVLSLAIIAMLVVMEPRVAFAGATIFAGSYFLVAFLVRRRLARNGIALARTNDERIQALQEGLGGIRDVILDQAQGVYAHRYARIEQKYRSAQASSQFTSMFPRVAVEAIGILLMVALVMYLSRASQDLMAMLPTVGLIAVGAQKLIPLLQQVYSGWSGVVTGQKSVEDVLGLLDFTPIVPPESAVDFRSEITLEDAGFSYPTAPERPVLLDVSLVIRRGEKIGIVGVTGSGKSTLVDMLMGLLPPASGRLAVDGATITPQNAAAWQRHVAHVPQSIYLSDASVAENIAFGVAARKIDLARVERAARAAGIHDHIASLPEGYRTPVGERGIRLSGGQRQRLGIARALYKDVDVLVLDEATSALDDKTEARVMAAIGELANDMTVIMIAHRVSTMRWCDRIIEIDRGRFRRQLDYATLIGERIAAGA